MSTDPQTINEDIKTETEEIENISEGEEDQKINHQDEDNFKFEDTKIEFTNLVAGEQYKRYIEELNLSQKIEDGELRNRLINDLEIKIEAILDSNHHELIAELNELEYQKNLRLKLHKNESERIFNKKSNELFERIKQEKSRLNKFIKYLSQISRLEIHIIEIRSDFCKKREERIEELDQADNLAVALQLKEIEFVREQYKKTDNQDASDKRIRTLQSGLFELTDLRTVIRTTDDGSFTLEQNIENQISKLKQLGITDPIIEIEEEEIGNMTWNLEQFSGENNTLMAQEYAENVEQMVKSCYGSEPPSALPAQKNKFLTRKIGIFTTNLTGTARTWYHRDFAKNKPNHTYGELVHAFVSKFQNVNQQIKIQNDIENCNMKKGENVLNFYVRIQKLVGIAYASDSPEVQERILRQSFVQGLPRKLKKFAKDKVADYKSSNKTEISSKDLFVLVDNRSCRPSMMDSDDDEGLDVNMNNIIHKKRNNNTGIINCDSESENEDHKDVHMVENNPNANPRSTRAEGTKFCKYCSQHGHSISNCFKKKNDIENNRQNKVHSDEHKQLRDISGAIPEDISPIRSNEQRSQPRNNQMSSTQNSPSMFNSPNTDNSSPYDIQYISPPQYIQLPMSESPVIPYQDPFTNYFYFRKPYRGTPHAKNQAERNMFQNPNKEGYHYSPMVRDKNTIAGNYAFRGRSDSGYGYLPNSRRSDYQNNLQQNNQPYVHQSTPIPQQVYNSPRYNRNQNTPARGNFRGNYNNNNRTPYVPRNIFNPRGNFTQRGNYNPRGTTNWHQTNYQHNNPQRQTPPNRQYNSNYNLRYSNVQTCNTNPKCTDYTRTGQKNEIISYLN